jgi:hypothetical protein
MLDVRQSTNLYRVDEEIMGSTINSEKFNS